MTESLISFSAIKYFNLTTSTVTGSITSGYLLNASSLTTRIAQKIQQDFNNLR